MAANLAGLPKSDIQVSDISTLLANALKGRFCVQLPLERGEIGKPVLMTSDQDLLLKGGRRLAGTVGWAIANIALKLGAQLYVSRTGHYTDVYDKSTLVGTKTSGNITKSVAGETLAEATFTVTVVGDDGDEITLFVDNGSSMIEIGTYNVDIGSDEEDDIATGLRASINTGTGTHGYSASGSGDDVDITPPTGSGAAANSYILKKVVTGDSDGTISQFTGGVTQVLSGDAGVITFEGKHIGPAYVAGITTRAASSGDTSKVDIVVTLQGYEKATETIKDVPRVPSTTDIINANNKSELIKILTVTTRIPYGSVTLTGGTYDYTLINDNDIIGVSLNNTGIYAFNEVLDANYFATFEYVNNTYDNEVVTYCSGRKDMRAILKMPFGLTIAQSKDYRNQTGSYNGTKIDNFYGRYIYGDVGVSDPDDKSNTIEISGIGHVCGARAKADNNGGEWISDSGEAYKHAGIKYLLYNFGEPGNIGQADDVYENASGINPIIKHPSFGFVTWGNRSLLVDTTKLTSKENIANLMIPIVRFLKTAADKKLFKPNDPLTWNELYREAKQFITTVLEPGRAIRPIEGTGWAWIGDQNVDTVDDIKFNIRAEIDAGKYRVRFVFQPIAAIEYIGIEATATDGQNFEVAIDNAA